MRGSSRDALAAARERLDRSVAGGTRPPAELAGDLFAVAGVLSGSAAVRRALTDPSKPADAKADLVHRLLGGKIGDDALELVADLARDRWGDAADITDAVEALGVSAVLASAEGAGRLDAVEDELFRFSRTVSGDPGLRDAFSIRSAGTERKAGLVHRLLDERAAPESVQLAVQAATAPRGLRTEQVLERFVEAAAERRQQLVAEVVTAVPLTDAQRSRLADGLHRLYGRDVQVNVDVDPQVVGGLRVQVGGELIDGTVLGRLESARRRLAG